MSQQTKAVVGLADFEAKVLLKDLDKLIARVHRRAGNVLYRKIIKAIEQALSDYKKYGT